MLKWRLVFACMLAASLGAAPARAQKPSAAAEPAVVEFVAKGDAGLLPTPGPNGGPPVDAPYPHIYQAPLFGTLFAVSSSEAAVDESALRYYASLHNFVRANAEIKRLKSLHPNWTPPTNIYSTAGAGADEQPFWDLLAADRFEELRAGIALKERSKPGWKPSRDLLTKIARKSDIETLVRNSNEKKPAEALAVADGDPSILHCAYMDANWRVADAFLDVGLPKRAFEIYHAIIATCPDHDERLTTVRKAISRFSFAQTASLIAMGAKSADGATEFDAAKIDLTRARIAAVNQGESKEAIGPEALADFFAEASRTKARADLGLAGWFEYNRDQFDKAEHWFSLVSLGRPAGADATAVNLAEGRALSLLKLGRVEDALNLSYIWRNVSKTMRETYIGASASLLTRASPPPDVSEKALADFVAIVETDRSTVGAQAIGWYRYNSGEWDDAALWFKSTLVWTGVDAAAGPRDRQVDAEVASLIEGYGRALAHAHRMDEATRLADRWRVGGAALETVFVNLMSGAIEAAPSVGVLSPDQLADFADIARARQLVAGAASLGWLHYRSSDYANAIVWFRDAIGWSQQGRGDLGSNQGLALSLKQTGQFAEAEEVAWTFAKDSADMRAIYVSAVVAQLSPDKAALSGGRLNRFIGLVGADRSSVGAQALGWYRLKQGNCAYAAPWFRRATAWSAAGGEDADTARGLALSLKSVGDFALAEDLAYAWRDRDPELRKLYVAIGVEELTSEAPVIAVSEARVRRLSEQVLSDHNLAGARAIGWWRYRQAACGFGGQWLRLAIDWNDADKRDAKTDEGFGLTLRATGRLTQAARLARPWADSVPLMKKLYIDVMVEELSRDNPPEPIDEARLKDFVGVIEPIKSPLGAQALGWYRLERNELDEAARWFKNAIDWWPPQRLDLSKRLSAPVDDYQPILAKLALDIEDYRRTPRAYPNSSSLIGKSTESYVNTEEGFAKTQEGYAQTLRALGRVEEAEAIAWAWRDRWPSLRQLYVYIAADELARADGPEISPERLRRYAAAIEDARSAPAAAAMAWRLLRAKSAEPAAQWFEKALAWAPSEPPDAGLVEGYVAALQGARKFAEADKFAARWRGVSPRFDLIYLKSELASLRASGGADAASAAKYADIESEIDKSRSGEGALSLGWLAYETKDYERALTWFRHAVEWGGDASKSREGVALSLRALERFADLAEFSYAERGVSTAIRDVYYGGMIAWLTADKPLRDVAPEARAHFEQAVLADKSVAAAQALGWGAAMRGEWPASRRWFDNAVAWSGFDPLAVPVKPDADRVKLVEGLVQALRGAGDAARAENVAFVWRDESPALAGLYLQIFTQALSEDATPLAPQRLARFAAYAQSQRSSEAAGALGWRFYRAKAPHDAIGWFERALVWAPEGPPPAKLAEGYALSLRAAGRLLDTENFAYGLVADPDMRAAYISVVVAELAEDKADLAPARLDRFVAVVADARSAIGAQALGWRRLNQDNCVYAAPWFRKARAWSSDATEEAQTTRGLALALRKVGAFAQAEDLAYGWGDRNPEMRSLFVDIGIEELTSEAPVIAMSEPRVRRLSERVLSERHVKGARALAWWRYRQAGCGYGGDWFRLATGWNEDDKRDAKTDEGFGLTLRASGRLARAEALAYPWIDAVPLMKKLYIDVLVEELSRDNPPEPVDEARLKAFVATIEPIKSPLGAQALGWYRLERGELDEAARWFKNAIDWWPPQKPDHSRRLSAPVDDYKPILARLALEHNDYRRTPRAYPNSSSLIGKSTEDYVNTEQGFAKTQEGYVQTLRALGRVEEAEAIAFAWRDRSPSLRALYLDMAATELDRRDGPALAPERLQRFLEAIEADQSPAGAAAMAWRQFRFNAFENASDWFQKALAWSKGAAPPPSLVAGYVMALQGAKKFEAAKSVAEKWRGASVELNLVYVQSELQWLRATGKADNVTAAQFAEIEKTMNGAKSADGALSLAWIAYDVHDYAHALLWFRNAALWGADTVGPKAKEGIALSLRGLEKFEELAAFGYAERAVSPALHDAYFGGMVVWLTSDKPLREVKPEARAQFEQAVGGESSVVGAQALAWGSLMRNDWGQARKWFETAIDWSGFDALAPQGPQDADHSKLVEGYVQALRASGELGRAEDVAYIWRDESLTLGGLYLEIFTQELSADKADLTDERIARFAAVAEARRSPPAAGALGWRAYRGKTFADAISWFEKAIHWSPSGKGDAKLDEGYALSLRASGRLVEAEDFAWDHRAESREIRTAYVAAFSDQLLDPKLSPKLSALRLARFGQIVTSDKISTGASALGWRRIQDGNCGYSLGWFRKAIAWSEGGRGDDKLYSGFAQGLRAVGMFNEAEDAAFTWADRSAEAHELYINIVIEELTRQWPRVPMNETRTARFAGLVQADRSTPGAQALGWRRYMQAGCGYGGRWFELAANWAPDRRGDAHLNEGYALTLRATGRLTRAESIAYPWIERAPAMKKLYIDVAVEELSRDNPPEPIPETRVAAFETVFASIHSALGAQALGWYRFARHENEGAAHWFQLALDWWPSLPPDANQKLATPVDDYKPILAQLALRPEDYRRTPRAYPNSSLLIGHSLESYVNTEAGLAKTVEGYVRALFALSRYDQAEALALRWADRWPPLRGLLIDMAAAQLGAPDADRIQPDRLARFAKLIEDGHSPTGAEALGWRAYKAKDYVASARWFRSAVDWRPADGKMSFEVVRGLADSLGNLKQYDEALNVVSTWRARMPELDDVGVEIGLDSVKALDPTSPTAIARIQEIAANVSKTHSTSGALSLGWLAYGRKEHPGAEAWFRKAIEWTPTGGDPDPKALEGYARALQGEQRFDDFMRFTGEWSERSATLKPLYLEAAAQTLAVAAANGEDVPTDTLARAGKAFAEARSFAGAQALAWQRISRKDWIAAAAWFQAARNWSKASEEDPKTTEGLIIALRSLKRDDEAEALAYRGASHDEVLRGLYLEIVADRLTRSPPSPPDENGMRRYAETAIAAKSGNGAQALGWYSYNARQYSAAVAWFEKAISFEPTENAALGLAFAYRKIGDRANYARVIQAYRETYAKIAELGGRRGSTRERRAAFESDVAPIKRFRATLSEYPARRVTSQGAGAGGGSALGWRLLNQSRPIEAAQAFESALQTTTGRARQDAAYGRSLALLAAGDTGAAGRSAASIDLNKQQRNEVGVQLLARRAWDAYNADRYAEALHWLDRRAAFAPETRDLIQMRAWCLQRLGRTEQSSAIQSQLDQQLSP